MSITETREDSAILRLTAGQEERSGQLGNFISAVELLGDLLMACKVFSPRECPCR